MSVAEMDLYDYLDAQDEQEQQDRGFVVDSLEKAEWCMRKLAKIHQQDMADEELAQHEIERIQAWLQARKETRQRSREYFEEKLRQYHQRLLDEDPKGNRTVKLPHGTLKARKLPDKWDYDDQTIIEWAKANQSMSLIRIKYEPDKKLIKEYVKTTGELIPGVTITPQGTKFDVEVDV
ncbi:host-nuclease inhibitor Gam family protein [Alicyclobacillus shizuokensis]|uniref:host-nuclease inhibitor Gam family protein n=1 Tax=Alicyclobacillus shizuokensis TaxID=392014 RepID=UPI0008374117|nr:host-nuclease inhibitor Gam family protein [Alicyclobacillus shizuokensis]